MKEDHYFNVKRLLNQVCGIFGCVVVVLLVSTFVLSVNIHESGYLPIDEAPSSIYLRNYDISTLGASSEEALIKRGYELFVRTPEYIGPDNGDRDKVFSGNNLSCNNCHLLAGTKAFAAPLIGVIKRFPQYRGREDQMGTIEERINGCMERSMNGRKMAANQEEMQALVAYLSWLSRFAPPDGKIEGQGFMAFTIPERPVDLDRGKEIFYNVCSECHGFDGQGVVIENSKVYMYPPLWGPDSFNNGAGMTRVITAAEFIKGNMPYGTTYLNPQLTDEDAYDVAGYITFQSRPEKSFLERDYPDLLKKPVSTPYPPYVDSFPQDQHRLGPFQPIMKYYKDKFGITKSK